MYRHEKLRGKIKEKIGSEFEFAKLIGLSQASLSAKLNGKSDFSRTEIVRMSEVLELKNSEEFYNLFFLKI